MKDETRTKAELITELDKMRQRVTELEALVAHHKQTEAALRESKKYLSITLDRIGDAVIAVDREGRIVYMNSVAENLMGWTLDQAKMCPLQEVFHIVNSHTGEKVADLVEQIICQGKSSELAHDIRLISKNGNEYQLDDSPAPIKQEDGEIAGVVLVFQDISEKYERKRVEKALEEERNLLRTVIDNLPDYIYVKDTESRFVLNNIASLHILGVTTQEEALGKIDFDFYPPELARQYYADEQSLMQSGQLLVNKEEPHTNGLWLLTTKVPLRDSQGKITGVIGIGRDITELKQAKEAVIVSRDALQRLIQQLPVGVQVFDTQGLCVDVNEALMQIFGLNQREQLIGRYNLFADSLARQVGTQAAGREALAGRIIHLPEVAFDFSQADPRFAQTHGHRIISVTFFPVRNGHNEVIQIVALNEDVTTRKQLEEQLRQSQKLEAVGQMAGGVAHNFNNMLTTMMGYTGLALEALPLDHPVVQDLKNIQKTTQQAANLTQQLLAFTRRQVTQPVVLNLNDMLADMQTLLRQLINEAVELFLLPAPSLGQIKVDPSQLEQVLVNLIVNARDAMPNGGQLTIRTANVILDQTYTAQNPDVSPGPYVMLAVSDTGFGINEEIKAHIFEPFFTTKEVGQGTGLGLSICFGIIKQNNGHISVDSKLGQGTTFKIYLPRIVEETPAILAPQPQIGHLPQGNETILLVEDDKTVREMTLRVLRQQGYTVLTAMNGKEALQTIQAHATMPLHLLITDIVMPQIAGDILANQLKTLHPAIKVLFISGHTDNTIIRQGILEATVSFLRKPFTPDILVRKVRAILDDEDDD